MTAIKRMDIDEVRHATEAAVAAYRAAESVERAAWVTYNADPAMPGAFRAAASARGKTHTAKALVTRLRNRAADLVVGGRPW